MALVPVERRRAQPAAAGDRLTIASASTSGAAESTTKPLTPSSISSVAGVLGALDHDRWRAEGGRLDDHQTVALALGGMEQAGRRLRSRRITSSWVTLPGSSTTSVSPSSRDSARASPRSPGRRRGSRSASPGTRSPRRAIAAGIAGTRFSGMCRPAATTSGGAGSPPPRPGCGASARRPAYSPVEPDDRRAMAVLAQPLLGEPGEGEAPIRQPQAEALDREPDPAADRPQVGAPVVAAPDLVPVDDQAARASGSAAAPARRRAVRSRGRRRCERRRSAGHSAAGARRRRARSRSGGQIRRRPGSRVELARRRDGERLEGGLRAPPRPTAAASGR